MRLEEVKVLVESKYKINISSIEKIKNVYKINTLNGKYCLKVVNYEFSHFLFIISAIKYLQKNGFKSIPNIIKTDDDGEYIVFDKGYAYLTKWVKARECNYDNPLDVKLAALKLAQLHKKTVGFSLTKDMKPRIGWFKWGENFKNRKNEMLNFRKEILDKNKKTEFDSLYLKIMDDELYRADKATQNLMESDYLVKMAVEVNKKGFCHHDYAHHNILVGEEGNVNIIDFDYCILDTHLHDLSSLLIRVMKNGKWDMNEALFIMDSYNSVFKIEDNDIPIIAAFMEFPQAYWQVGIQYYLEKQPWSEEFFMKKLNKIYEDREERQEFLDDFRNIKYSSLGR